MPCRLAERKTAPRSLPRTRAPPRSSTIRSGASSATTVLELRERQLLGAAESPRFFCVLDLNSDPSGLLNAAVA